MPIGAAITTAANTFTTSQTITGNLILSGANSAIQFADGSTQTSAALGGTGVPTGFMILGSTPVAPPGFTVSGVFSVGNTWSTVAPMPTARRFLAAAYGNGNIYAIGGRGNNNGDNNGDNTVEVYNPGTNTWNSVAPMSTNRYGLAAVAVANGNIFAIGGVNNNNLSPNYLNTVEVYIPGTNTWGAVAPMSTARFGLAAAVDASGNIYAIGGYDGAANLSTMELYSSGTWFSAAPMPTARRELAAAVDANGKIYAIGGFNGAALNTVEVYNPATNTWSTAAPMPTARYDLAAAVDAKGNIYAIGGYNNGALNTVEVYNPATNTWSTAAPMPTAHDALAAANDGIGNIYAIGGSGSKGFLNTVERYSPPATLYTFTKN